MSLLGCAQPSAQKWIGWGAVTAASVAGLVWIVAVVSPGDQWPTLATACRVALAAGVIGSGVLFQTHWVLTRWESSAWTALACLGLGGYLAWTTVLDAVARPVPLVWETLGLLCLVTVLVVRGVQEGFAAGPRLWLMGLVAATVAALATFGLSLELPDPALPPRSLSTGAVLLLGLTAFWAILARTRSTPWVRTRLAVISLLVTAGQAMAWTGLEWPTLAVPLVHASTAALLVHTSAHLLLASIADVRRAIDNLRSALERQELEARQERAILHEVRSTVSGLAQAVPLLRSDDVPTERQERLEDMVSSELDRLDRMTRRTGVNEARPVDLDRILERVVLRQQVRGQNVLWQPSGHALVAQPDSVAEILGILLENSRRHAGGTTTVVEVSREDELDQLSIALSDNGRGVAANLREDIFRWGSSGPASPGQGIGLSVARDLARENGGDVVLDETKVGARFVLTMPASDRSTRLRADGGTFRDVRSA